jgi:hypothetical protein
MISFAMIDSWCVLRRSARTEEHQRGACVAPRLPPGIGATVVVVPGTGAMVAMPGIVPIGIGVIVGIGVAGGTAGGSVIV